MYGAGIEFINKPSKASTKYDCMTQLRIEVPASKKLGEIETYNGTGYVPGKVTSPVYKTQECFSILMLPTTECYYDKILLKVTKVKS